MRVETATDLKSGPGVIGLWAGVLVGPSVVLVQLTVNYALVLWACGTGHTWVLHFVSLLALLLTAATGFVAAANWYLLAASAREDGGGTIPRSRFMAILGTLLSLLMSLVIIAMWVPVFLYGPCER